MIFIYLAPQHKIVISRDIVKSMDKYVLLACAPAGLLCHMVFTDGHFHACSLSCALKRFPRTPGWKMVMSWVNPAFLRTRGKRFQGCSISGRCASHNIGIRRRDAATLRFWVRWFSMSYKKGRGNVAKKSLRFHATVKRVSDYQLVTKHPVAASRCTFNFMLPTGSCVDMPRHGVAQSWVIRMPGFIRRQESKRLSSSGRGEPFPTAPRRPGGR